MAGIANQVLAMLADEADRPWLLHSRIGQTGRILANWPSWWRAAAGHIGLHLKARGCSPHP